MDGKDAVTIAISTVISTINSLTLSPALAAMLLKPHDAPKDRLKAKAQADPTVLSSAQAMAGLTALGEEVLPPGMDFEWTDLSYQQATQGNAALVVFPLPILLVALAWLSGCADEQRFWAGFEDPMLAGLIRQTLDANRDLRAALARYQRAEALLRGSRAEQLPSVGVSASAAEQHLADVERTPPGAGDDRVELYQAAAGLSWELDLFARLRRASEAQRAELGAAGADLAALQVALVGQLATCYFELRGLQQQRERSSRQDPRDLVYVPVIKLSGILPAGFAGLSLAGKLPQIRLRSGVCSNSRAGYPASDSRSR